MFFLKKDKMMIYMISLKYKYVRNMEIYCGKLLKDEENVESISSEDSWKHFDNPYLMLRLYRYVGNDMKAYAEEIEKNVEKTCNDYNVSRDQVEVREISNSDDLTKVIETKKFVAKK